MTRPDQRSVTVGDEPWEAMLVASVKDRHRLVAERLPEGPGWIESNRIPKLLRVSVSHAGKVARDMVRNGTWEVFRGTKFSAIANANRSMVWYRVKSPKK